MSACPDSNCPQHFMVEMEEINARLKTRIESTLRKFPEVLWDRWAGEFDRMVVFGWIKRADGKHDFLTLKMLSGQVVEFATSSAVLSEVFAKRLGFTEGHLPCKRVENDFDEVGAIHV